MPFLPSKLQGDVPDKPHLALRMPHGEALPIPVGATLIVVHDPTRANEVEYLILSKVTKKAWEFKCACNPKCTVFRRMLVTENGGVHNR